MNYITILCEHCLGLGKKNSRKVDEFSDEYTIQKIC